MVVFYVWGGSGRLQNCFTARNKTDFKKYYWLHCKGSRGLIRFTHSETTDQNWLKKAFFAKVSEKKYLVIAVNEHSRHPSVKISKLSRWLLLSLWNNVMRKRLSFLICTSEVHRITAKPTLPYTKISLSVTTNQSSDDIIFRISLTCVLMEAIVISVTRFY